MNLKYLYIGYNTFDFDVSEKNKINVKRKRS